MTQVVTPLSSGFPQTGSNRTRNQLIADILSYVGGEGRTDAQARAGASLDASVRAFNSVAWKFNRLVQDITFTSSTADYALSTNFRSPLRAMLLDASDKTIATIAWVPYEEWTILYPSQQASSTIPSVYTARNVHETGLVTFDPPLSTSPFTYPKARIHYHRRIALAPGAEDVLNVPIEVEEALVQHAVAHTIAKVQTFAEARDAFALARALRLDVEAVHRDFEDF